MMKIGNSHFKDVEVCHESRRESDYGNDRYKHRKWI